jgi:putative ABC transport system permease protein
MKVLNTTRIALYALARNKLRSALTALGIIIGVGSLIALLSVGNGAQAEVEAQVAGLGQNVIEVKAGSITKNAVSLGMESAGGLTLDDAEAIQREIPGVVAVSPEFKIKAQIVAGNRNWRTSVYGNSIDYFTIRQWKATKGEFFTEHDVRGATKVAVIGKEVVEELFGEENPIGETIRIQNVPFTVVGVLKAKGSGSEDDDDNIIVPYTTAIRHLIGKRIGLRKIHVQAASLEELPKVEKKISELLLQRHRVAIEADEDAEADDFFKVTSQLEIAESATATSRTMTVLLGLIASVSLVVGGIGIMNIMLVSVTERTREIGIRMAVGAHRRDIRRQFVIEAFLISVLGGLIGIVLGAGTATLLTELADWPTLVSPDSILIAFVFSAAVGIFFGIYPARKASLLDPIDALRYE